MLKFISGTAALLGLLWGIAYYLVNNEQHQYAPVSADQAQAAKDYLEGKLTAAPKDWRWQNFEANPGVALRTGSIRHKESKGTVIVVPGFTGSIEMIMREIVQIHAAGFSVAAIEYRGQGESYRPISNPEKGYVQDYGLLASEVAEFAKSVREPNKPLFFYSISKGAHITLRMAAEYDPGVQGYALMVPMVKINTGELAYDLVRNMANSLNFLGLGKMYAPGQGGYEPEKYGVATPCNANPETAQSQGALFALNERLRSRGSSIKWLHETIKSSHKLMTPNYSQSISQPVKMFTAGIDHLVDTGAAEQLCSDLPSCSLTHIAEARHCITREDFTVYDALVDEAIDHFEAAL